MRTTLGPAQKIHLDRAARTAGEAFAFEEPETARASHRSVAGNALWLVLALPAALALWLAF